MLFSKAQGNINEATKAPYTASIESKFPTRLILNE